MNLTVGYLSISLLFVLSLGITISILLVLSSGITLNDLELPGGIAVGGYVVSIEKIHDTGNTLVKKSALSVPGLLSLGTAILYNGTDATMGIQTAVNNVLPGQEVNIYNGSYSVTQPLNIRSGVYLRGQGNDTILEYSNLGDNRTINMERGSHLSDVKLSGSIKPFPGDFSQKIVANDNVVIENLVISKMGYGVETAGKHNVTLRNIRCEFIQSINDTGACVHAGPEDGNRTSNLLVDRFTIVDSNRGIELDANSSNVIVQYGNMVRIKNFNNTGKEPFSLAVQSSDGEGGGDNITFRHVSLVNSAPPSTKIASDSDIYDISDLPRNVLYLNITVINPVSAWVVNGKGVTIKDSHLINDTENSYVIYKNSQDIWIQNVTSNVLHTDKYFASNPIPKHTGIQNVSIIGNTVNNSPNKTGPTMSFYDITNLTLRDNVITNVPQGVDVISTRDVRNLATDNNSITYFEGRPYNSTNSILPESTRKEVGTELKLKDN